MKVFVGIQLVVVFLAFLVIVALFWKFIKENRVYRNHIKKLDQWSKFNDQLMEWSVEIVDVEVRVNFINHCADKLVRDSKGGDNMLDTWSLEEEKQKICKEWGHHIPSLLQEMRDRKLNKIL
jgi:hypothetical protein